MSQVVDRFVFDKIQSLNKNYLNCDYVDSENMQYMFFIGVMFGVHGAATTLRKFAEFLAKQVSKKLLHKALKKGTIYPIVKKVSISVRIRKTKQILADGVSSVIPVVGGALSGGLTFFVQCWMLMMNPEKTLTSDQYGN